jgi:hypothetical protein
MNPIIRTFGLPSVERNSKFSASVFVSDHAPASGATSIVAAM